jgi:SAM-dependent methyltransferase
MPHADADRPSPWVCRFAALIPAGGRVLDLACGRGRHALYLAARGYFVEAVDRDAEALACLRGHANVSARVADLEKEQWPYDGERFAGIVVTNYLHRPLFPLLLAALSPAAVLIYETFAAGNERFGKPRNPDHLLAPDELLETVRGKLRVIAFEDVIIEVPKPAAVQRICAIAP